MIERGFALRTGAIISKTLPAGNIVCGSCTLYCGTQWGDYSLMILSTDSEEVKRNRPVREASWFPSGEDQGLKGQGGENTAQLKFRYVYLRGRERGGGGGKPPLREERRTRRKGRV